MIKRFILVGADPLGGKIAHPGGQLTACEGLIRYGQHNNIAVDVIDTTQSSFPVPPIMERIRKGIRRITRLYRSLSCNEYDGVIIFSSWGLSFYERGFMALLCKFRNVPSLFFVRSGHFMNELRGSWFRRKFASFLLRYPTIIGAQGQAWVEFYRNLGVNPEKTCVIRNWLSFDFEASDSPKIIDPRKPLRFVFVGWLVKAKGVVQLLKAVESLACRYKFELVFIGDGSLAEEIDRQATVIDNVKIESLGWVSRKKLQSELRMADVFVLPSEAEGFPNALLEAMASGLPVICTDVGAVSDSVHDGENGFLLPDNDPQTISEAMSAYLENPSLVEKHSAASLTVFQNQHGWEVNCKHLFSQFEKFY